MIFIFFFTFFSLDPCSQSSLCRTENNDDISIGMSINETINLNLNKLEMPTLRPC